MEKKNDVDDPIDDCTKWVGHLPKKGAKEPEHSDKRGSGRPIKPDI